MSGPTEDLCAAHLQQLSKCLNVLFWLTAFYFLNTFQMDKKHFPRCRFSDSHLHRVVCSNFYEVLDQLSSMLEVDVSCKKKKKGNCLSQVPTQIIVVELIRINKSGIHCASENTFLWKCVHQLRQHASSFFSFKNICLITFQEYLLLCAQRWCKNTSSISIFGQFIFTYHLLCRVPASVSGLLVHERSAAHWITGK